MSMMRDLYISRGPAAAFASVGLYWGAFGALVPDIKPQVGLSDGGFGLALLISTTGAIAAMWIAPWITAALGRRVLPILAVVMGLAFCLPGMAFNGVTFSLAMMLGAMSTGTLDVAMNARLSVLESMAGRSLMNLNHGIFSVAYALSALLTGFAREAGWAPVQVFAALGILTALLAVQMLRAPVIDPPRDADAPPSAALSWWLLLPGGLIILIAFLAEQGTEGWSALHLERNLGAGAAEGAMGPAILGGTMAVGRLSGQVIVQRFNEASVIRIAALMTAAGSLIAAWAPSLAMAYAGFGMLGLGVSVMAPMGFAWIGRMVPLDRRALAISRLTVVGYTGFFVGPPMMGGLSQLFGLSASFTAVALLLLLVPLVLIPLVQRYAASHR